MWLMVARVVATAIAVQQAAASRRRSAPAKQKCEYCGTDDCGSLRKNCGAPNEDHSPMATIDCHYGVSIVRPSHVHDGVTGSGNMDTNTEAERKKRREKEEEEAARRRRNNDTSYSYTPPSTDTSYSPPDTSSDTSSGSSDYSGGGGSFDGGGASGDW